MIQATLNAAIDRFERSIPPTLRPTLWPGLLSCFLALYGILWHYTILRLGSPYVVADVADGFGSIVISYTIFGAIAAIILSLPLVLTKSPLFHRIVIVVAMILFGASELVRMFDWGALYFGGSHLDNNFWGHAFQRDGLVFMTTKEAFGLYAAVILFFMGLLFLLRRIARLGSEEAL